jgi:putative flippase GtrA
MPRFIKFNATSALGIIVQLGVLWILIHGLHVSYLPATILAVSAAVVHNFFWHWRWTWADRAIPLAGAPAALVRFAAANGAVSLAGNVVLMAVLVRGAHVAPVAANLIAIAACGVINYWLGDRLVFTGVVRT